LKLGEFGRQGMEKVQRERVTHCPEERDQGSDLLFQ